jgi:glycosyltransferase involved in cell wall biosynthesis
MRILYHHRTASRDGQAVHIDELIAALRSLGHEVRVVSPRGDDAKRMGSKLGWAHWLKAALPKAVYELLELSYSVVALARLAHAVREFRPDVIYERYNLFLMAGLMARRCFGLPLLLEVNAPLVFERTRFGGLALTRIARWSERTVWRGADRVLPVTRVLAQHILAAGVNDDRVTVIHNGVNEAHFAGSQDRAGAKAQFGLSGRLVLGFVGFIREWHGVDRVIRWMGAASAPANVHLLVVGDGPARTALERLAQQHGLADRVTFTGVVARARMPQYIAAFDVALQPAVVPYASPLKVFEYLALGKPIVAPRQPNIEEILDDGANALLFSPDDPGGLAAALERIVNDANLRTALGANALATIRARGLTWTDNAKRVLALGAELVPRAAPREGALARTPRQADD